MLIRSNWPFQDGGNGETIMPEESRPLKVPGRRNGGQKQMVGCRSVSPSLPLFFPHSLPLHFLSPVSFCHECKPTVQSRGTSSHYNLPGTLPNNHTPLTESLFISRVSNTHTKNISEAGQNHSNVQFIAALIHSVFLMLARQIHDNFSFHQCPFAAFPPPLSINQVK